MFLVSLLLLASLLLPAFMLLLASHHFACIPHAAGSYAFAVTDVEMTSL
jgi:hypothetical protein